MENFDEIRQTLVERKVKLAELLGRVEVSARRQFDKSLEEQAIQRENEEILTQIDDNLNLEFVQVERALARLDAGDYGFCENCGDKIASNRLQAIPQTSFCLKCAA
ncbi:MAG: TraR/DksA C4-type zinc finger protein [Acidobacteria bacterium]|nr:TraR/DksA C4-type zinc finger protein [Acidobacteriota bacterium]